MTEKKAETRHYALSSDINEPVFFSDKYIFALSKHLCIPVFDLCVQVLAMGQPQGPSCALSRFLPNWQHFRMSSLLREEAGTAPLEMWLSGVFLFCFVLLFLKLLKTFTLIFCVGFGVFFSVLGGFFGGLFLSLWGLLVGVFCVFVWPAFFACLFVFLLRFCRVF